MKKFYDTRYLSTIHVSYLYLAIVCTSIHTEYTYKQTNTPHTPTHNTHIIYILSSKFQFQVEEILNIHGLYIYYFICILHKFYIQFRYR